MPYAGAMRRRARVLFVVVLLLAVFACKKKTPKAGDPCRKEGDFTCTTGTQRMVCTGGKYVEETCTECTQKKGFGSSSSFFAGCVVGGVGPEGSACPSEDSTDCDGAGVVVKCTGGTYHHYKCGGPNGCRHSLTGVSCDQSVGAEGDPCREENDAACSADKKNMLHCKSGKLVADRTCKGPKSCAVDGKDGSRMTLECDTSLGDVGDPCGSGGTCSTDRSAVVICNAGKYELYNRCRGANPHCLSVGDASRCAEPGISEVGDPCTGVGAACSGDGKAFLECKNGAWAQAAKCKSCKVTGTDVTCSKH